MRLYMIVSILLIFGFSGCNNSSEAELVKDNKKESIEIPKDNSSYSQPKLNTTTTNTPSLSKFYQIFKDGAKIDPQGRVMLLVFGQPSDPYTQKLQKDINSNPKLANMIKKSLTAVYIDASLQKRHKFMHSGELMDVDTKTLISIYHINATPTLIFIDKEGKSIFIVPGYMPPKQFIATLKFVNEGVWRDKDRKNGEIYMALKEYYKKHNIELKGAKK